MVEFKPVFSQLRWLKWFCTLCASFAAAVALGSAINWIAGDGDSSGSSFVTALALVVAALTARYAIAMMLGDKR
jgi:hypothetical protein